ncbi:MAG: thioredoxin family protein [Planctomycetota bacterium]|nr:MAG: thioredoxin family protein [Planctomycetota bacterium]
MSVSSRTLVAVVILTVLLPIARAEEKAQPPNVEVELLADASAILPGKSAQLAVAFKLPEGWHIYWRNRGEGGMEPAFKWNLPKGFTVGPMKFPAPERHVDKAGIHTFILAGNPTILTYLKAPPDLKPGQSVNIILDVEWFICKDLCYKDNETLTLKLPVVADNSDIKHANELVFMAAHRRLPLPTDKAEYMKRISTAASVDKVKPGSKFQVAVVLEIKDKHHINSHRPLQDFLIATDLFHDQTDGLSINRPKFPKGHLEPSLIPGQRQSVYRGKTVIVLPIEADKTVTGPNLRISGVVTYQACSDKDKTCFFPTAVEWSLTLPVAGPDQNVKAVNTELFGSSDTGSAPGGFTLDSDIKTATYQTHHSLWGWLALALLAGLILNVTPCVLPVISIKVLSFVQQAAESPAKVFKLGLAFCLGMMIVFNILAILATGLGLVWGQHFQSPVFTIAMATVVFAFALSLFGVFTLGVPKTVGDAAVYAEKEGYVGSIAKGGLATVMGTPCLGPFLGPVLLWASGQTVPMIFLIFNTIGVGMALPYILLTANPNWLRFVPKPGPWLITFKQAMAFLLMGTVIYLLYILEGQLGGNALVWALVFLTGTGLACWTIGTWLTANTSPRGRITVLLVALLIVAASAWLAFAVGMGESSVELPWQEFSLERLNQLTAEGKTVLLDITADWCPNCKYNLGVVFNTSDVADVVARYNVVPLLADWTAYGENITQLIQKLAPGGSIPVCAIFPAGRPDEPIVMLGTITKKQVINAILDATR